MCIRDSRWDFGKDNLDLKEYGFTLLEDQKVEDVYKRQVKYYICLQKQTVMKRSRLFLWIFGILMQAFLILSLIHI